MIYADFGTRLAPLIKSVRNLTSRDTYKDNALLLSKAKKIALEEKRWDACVFVYEKILYYISNEAAGSDVVSLCVEYLRFLKNHADAGLEQTNYPEDYKNFLLYGIMYVIWIYEEYPQVNDKQIVALLNTLKEYVRKYGNEFLYIKAQLQHEIQCKNIDGIKKLLDKFIRMIPLESCYICESRLIQWSYMLLDEPEKAIAIRDDFIAQRIPKGFEIDLTRCQTTTMLAQNHELLEYAITLNKYDIFYKHAEETHTLALNEGSSYKLDLVVSSYLCQFDNMGNELEVIRECENTEDLPHENMITSLFVWCYLKGLQRANINTIPLCFQQPIFNGANSNECPVESAIEYFEAIADDLGEQFSKSRSTFDYADLKGNLFKLSQGL